MRKLSDREGAQACRVVEQAAEDDDDGDDDDDEDDDGGDDGGGDDLSGLEMVGMEKGIAQQFRVNTFNLIAE